MTRVGFIGLGAMGGALAERLVAGGIPLLVHDRSDAAVARLTGLGAAAATLDEVGAQCDPVFVCLPRSEDVKEVVSAEGGLASTMRSGACVVDMTTGFPPDDTECAEILARRGIGFADAPVSGGPGGARAGTLTIMVGASAERFAELSPILSVISEKVIRVGGVGAGHTMKLVNNLIAAASRLAVFEGVSLAVRNGLDAETCIEVLNGSTGRSYSTEVTFPRFLLHDEIKDQGFRIDLMLKDVALAMRLAQESETAAELGGLTEKTLETALQRFGTDADMSRLAGLYGNFGRQ
ncbi:NAD(P)-dependent oxidoreductase [Amycolatopsis jejuensis]|uniref:NAD(P)-dependent oxidoreductase n=1 Tax=Amycolatopsis jejuensis TaxID=330084 RepID=UPI0005255D03|nr:NAD(P)-dependent oxidoreductase [Amycolatopsis jejuensis]